MTEDEIRARLRRVYAALDDSTGNIERLEFEVCGTGPNFDIRQDFSGGRSQEQLEVDAASVINEIMGIRDRAKAWLKRKGGDPDKVDDFINSEPAVALVHDLANRDKHGQSARNPLSGHKPNLVKVEKAMTLTYDPATGTYASTGTFTSAGFNIETGEQLGKPSGSNVEIVLTSDIVDESGTKIGELQKVLPDAVYRWECFLASQGLALP